MGIVEILRQTQRQSVRNGEIVAILDDCVFFNPNSSGQPHKKFE